MYDRTLPPETIETLRRRLKQKIELFNYLANRNDVPISTECVYNEIERLRVEIQARLSNANSQHNP